MKLLTRTVQRLRHTPPDFTTQEIEEAATRYAQAAERARSADQDKRTARKLLDRISDGYYGAWHVERVPSGREIADLEAIRRIFAERRLGPVPMKNCAPSLKVTPLHTGGRS